VARIPDVGVDDSTVPDAWSMAADPIAAMYAFNGVARAWTGDLRGSVDQHAAARRRCAALPFPMGPFTDAYVLLVGSMASAHTGDIDGARECVLEAHRIAEERGFDAWLFWATILRTTYDASLAEPDQVAGLIAQAAMSADMLHAMGVRLFSSAMRGVMALIALGADDPVTARTMAEDSLRLAEDTGSRLFVIETLRVQALAGPEDEVEAGLVAALGRAEEEGSVISAVRIATDLVSLGGPAHRTRLESALSRVVTDTDRGAPVLADARAVLAASAG
jgi:hypothetical protein